MKKEETPNNFSDTFFSKLKEQSFTIIILVGVMLYQNWIFTNQMEEYKKIISEKEQIVLKLTEEERQRLIEREKYLVEQRDSFIDELKELVKNQK
jgi:hypothetical protein